MLLEGGKVEWRRTVPLSDGAGLQIPATLFTVLPEVRSTLCSVVVDCP